MSAVTGDALVGVQLSDVAAAFGAGLAALVMHLQKVADLLMDVAAHARSQYLGGLFQHLAALGVERLEFVGLQGPAFLEWGYAGGE